MFVKNHIIKELRNVDLVVILIAMMVFAMLLVSFNFGEVSDQQFTYLARSFIHGKLYFTELPNLHDVAPFNGKYYWPSGPLPAILLIPLVKLFDIFDLFFYQGYLEFFITLSIFYLLFRIAQILGYRSTDSLYLAFAFSAGSVYLYIALLTNSYFYAQALTVLLLLLAIYESLTKNRHWLIGLCLGAVLMTRVTAAVAVIFFILVTLVSDKKVNKIIKLTQLLSPMLIAFFLLLLYNYFRFQNIWESGYNLHLATNFFERSRSYGLFSLVHLPGNLYYFLLGHPLPVFRDGVSHVLKPPYITADPWGMSILITSPYYIYLFFGSYHSRLMKILWITVVAIAIPIFLYHGIGYIQFGYRYALDFLPFLFLLFLLTLYQKSPTLSLPFKILFITNSLTNFYLIVTLLFAGQ